MPSLREQVKAAVQEYLTEEGAVSDDCLTADVAQGVTAVMFATMAGQRPCVTCGKGIGPAKVARGYVQCYGCAKRNPLPITVRFTESPAGAPAAGD